MKQIRTVNEIKFIELKKLGGKPSIRIGSPLKYPLVKNKIRFRNPTILRNAFILTLNPKNKRRKKEKKKIKVEFSIRPAFTIIDKPTMTKKDIIASNI